MFAVHDIAVTVSKEYSYETSSGDTSYQVGVQSKWCIARRIPSLRDIDILRIEMLLRLLEEVQGGRKCIARVALNLYFYLFLTGGTFYRATVCGLITSRCRMFCESSFEFEAG